MEDRFTIKLFAEIISNGSSYKAILHQGNHLIGKENQDCKIGKSDKVSLRTREFSLEEVIRHLENYEIRFLNSYFQERGQLEMGTYLYKSLFGNLEPHQLCEGKTDVDLRILTDDEHIMKLPWVLLAYGGYFLSNANWSISLSSTTNGPQIRLPEDPKVLIIMPEVSTLPNTHAKEHLEEIEYTLHRHPRLKTNDLIHVCNSWESFVTTVSSIHPNIVYYFGHGKTTEGSTKLLFDDEYVVSVGDFADLLEEVKESLFLTYINCCSGHAGGHLGIGNLRSFVPTVITNRTFARTDAARKQGTAFFHNLLSKGLPPHHSMKELRKRTSRLGLSLSDIRWITPVIHCNYEHWNYNPHPMLNPLSYDHHWKLKVDRIRHFGTIFYESNVVLQSQKPRGLGYLWYGKEGQGIEAFHKRLKFDLPDQLPEHVEFLTKEPEWPSEFHEPKNSFKHMICEAFNVSDLEYIPVALRQEVRGRAGQQTIVYIRHQPIYSSNLINATILKQYVEWWDRCLSPLFRGPFFNLLGLSVQVNDPTKFRSAIQNRYKIEAIPFVHSTFRLLDEMEKLVIQDLRTFVNTHNILLPEDKKEEVLESILLKTKGAYDRTVQELEALIDDAVAEFRTTQSNTTKADEKDDGF